MHDIIDKTTVILVNIGTEFWEVLAAMSPYLLLGFLFAGLLSVVIRPQFIERHLGGRGFLPSFKASLFGVPLPLCSCGVIPVAASLRLNGASKGATSAFLISTPQTGVDSIFVTYSLMGLTFAVFRPLAAFVNGLIGGMLVDAFDTNDSDAQKPHTIKCDDGCEAPQPSKGKIFEALRYGFVTLPRDIGKALLIGLIITGLIGALLPSGFFSNALGTGIVAMLAMMLLGLPVYVCATASVPIAVALMMKGATPGAALVFLMTGPATNAAALAMIWKLLGRRSAIIYLISVAVTALCSGIALDFIFNTVLPQSSFSPMHFMPKAVENACAVVLLLLLFYALLFRRTPKKTEDSSKPHTIRFRISGMNCEHCVRSVSRVISESGATDFSVSLEGGFAEIRTAAAGSESKQGSIQAIDTEKVIEKLSALGFDAEVEE